MFVPGDVVVEAASESPARREVGDVRHEAPGAVAERVEGDRDRGLGGVQRAGTPWRLVAPQRMEVGAVLERKQAREHRDVRR